MTSNGSHGGSTAIESVKNRENKHCFCRKIARLCTSWTLKNLGRRFYTCAVVNVSFWLLVSFYTHVCCSLLDCLKKLQDAQGCHFFQWCDEAFTGRAFDVVTHLNHRRLYLEMKLKLVEEDLEQSFEKRKYWRLKEWS